jgi:CRP-like cAMP-binding protein
MPRHLNLAVFDGCNRPERTLIARLGSTVTVPAGQGLTTEGDAGQQVAVLLEGELSVRRDGQHIAAVRTGDYFDDIALIGPNAPAGATVEAVEAATVWMLSSSEFNELVEGVPPMANKLNHIALSQAANNAAS